MKRMILALALMAVTTQPAHAFSLRGLVGAPLFVVGFSAAMVADVTLVPIYKGFKHFTWWRPLFPVGK